MAKKTPQQSSKPKPKPKPTSKPSTTTAPSSTASPASSSTTASPLPPPPNAQHILDVFQHAFRPTLAAADEFSALVQEAKAALFERDFARAFSRPELLRAYAARWSPTRAACYAGVLGRLLGGGDGEGVMEEEGEGSREKGELRVVAFGGATAELAALSAFLAPCEKWKNADIALVDLAPWQSTLDPLYSSLTAQLPPTPYVPVPRPPLSSPPGLNYTFTQADALSLPTNPTLRAQVSAASLVTLLFTLNELYTSAGVGRTTAFLLSLTGLVRKGAVLVVVDSPGSYAETDVGRDGAKRRYPMKWLLDHTLLKQAGEGDGQGKGGGCWEKVREEESVWFRWGEGEEGKKKAGWRYPVGLEDMRFQMHVYRATGRGLRERTEKTQEGGQEGEGGQEDG